MDSTQLLITVFLSITTLIMIVVGIQLVFVLKELRQVLKRANNIADGFEKIGMSLEYGFTEITGFVAGLKTIFKVIDVLHAKKNGKNK
jgi:hypothetical protein